MKKKPTVIDETKVYLLVRDTCNKVKTFNRVEREVFFNAMSKANILIDPQLCDNILGVAFKKRQPQLKGMIEAVKGKLKENIKKLRNQHEQD